ncbi:GAF domain-containing sensor histidine kinase, partial [bacterium]|nr:GAF domain-containing sensor histidine kinase [bacterium]
YSLSQVFNKNLNLETLLHEFSSKLTEIIKVKYVRVILPEKKKIFDEHGKLRNIKMNFSDFLIETIEKYEIDIFLASSIPTMIKEEKKLGQNKDKIKALQIAEKESWKFGISVFVPILLDKKLLGFAILGEKKSGDLLSPDDLNLLRTISSQAAVALEKAQLYEQVKVYSKKLEEKVKERTRKIKGLQTEQKQMMLEIAHGLQTPLTIIKGELSSFQKTQKDNEKLLSFEKSIDRISKFIYDMLQLANLKSQVQPDKLELLSLSELLLELVEEFEIVTSDKNIIINNNIESGVYIKGDKARLEEMVSNLVSNSVKYMKTEGEKIISIKLYKKNKQAFLVIKDTGIGMRKEDLPKLFTRFFRIKDSQGENKGGTGLGLAICKKIVEMHKGKIKVKSEVRKGTKFIIEIPVI